MKGVNQYVNIIPNLLLVCYTPASARIFCVYVVALMLISLDCAEFRLSWHTAFLYFNISVSIIQAILLFRKISVLPLPFLLQSFLYCTKSLNAKSHYDSTFLELASSINVAITLYMLHILLDVVQTAIYLFYFITYICLISMILRVFLYC